VRKWRDDRARVCVHSPLADRAMCNNWWHGEMGLVDIANKKAGVTVLYFSDIGLHERYTRPVRTVL
jgi:hypothetical protein